MAKQRQQALQDLYSAVQEVGKTLENKNSISTHLYDVFGNKCLSHLPYLTFTRGQFYNVSQVVSLMFPLFSLVGLDVGR